MTKGILKVLVGIALIAAIIYALEVFLSENELWGAVRQFFIWGWQAARELAVRAVALVSKSGAALMKRTAGKTLLRHILRSIMTVIGAWILRQLVREFGERPTFLKVAWVRLRRRKNVKALRRILMYRPPLPRAVNALIGLSCIIGGFWLVVILNHHYSLLKVLLASTILFWALEKIPVFGCEALFNFIGEKWRPIKDAWRYLRIYQPRGAWWISWLWLQPMVDWLLQGLRAEPVQKPEDQRLPTHRIPMSH